MMNPESVFRGGGKMGAMMRSHDWSGNPLGPMKAWPQSLRTAISIMLDSRFPMYIAWGSEYIQFYNDGYRPILGSKKHPRALGISTRETFGEIWDIIGPMFDGVMQGTASGYEDFLLPMDRHGFVEECYFTFSYSPIREEGGGVGGVLVTVYETTKRKLGERRLKLLSDLASATSHATSQQEAAQKALEALSGNTADIPFASLYLLDATRPQSQWMGSIGDDASLPAVGPNPESGLGSPWPLAQSISGGRTLVPLKERSETLNDPVGRAAAPRYAMMLPITRAGAERPAGILVVGLSPRLLLDDDYRRFMELVAGQMATTLANVRAFQETEERARALAELDRAKIAFFSNVSHEFRTPLTLMLAPIEEMLSQQGEGLSPENLQQVQLLYRNSLRLLKLVNTLLDFSRIEAGRMEAVFAPVDISALTRDLASVFRSMAEKAGLYLHIECETLSEPAFIDAELWEKIVLNLVSNAYKFTLSGGITVSLREDAEAFLLSVKDTGTGITESDQKSIFSRFYRVRSSFARTHEGTGIGLALVNELVKMLGGSIRLESDISTGSTFTVRIPKGASHLPADRVQAEIKTAGSPVHDRTFLSEAHQWIQEPLEGEPEFPPAQYPARDGRARILVVEDNADMRGYLQRLLSKHWDVETASKGTSALKIVAARPPDLVLSDVMLPGIDGFELLRSLRARPETRFLPIILLSARAGEEAASEGLEAGADDYLIKPFSARELLTRVSAHIKSSQARKDAEARVQLGYRQLEIQRLQFHTLFMEAPAAICMLRTPLHQFEFANPAFEAMVGRRDLVGKSVMDAFPELAGQAILGILDGVYSTGKPFTVADYSISLDKGDGLRESSFTFTIQPSRKAEGAIDGILVFAFDVTTQVMARRLSEAAAERVAGQKQILEILAAGGPLVEVLDGLARVCETHIPGALVSIFLSDAENSRLRLAAAPSLSETFRRMMESFPLAATSGPCASAAFQGTDVITPDLSVDPAWDGYRAAAEIEGLKACWSFVIRSSTGAILGAFGLYFRERREPITEESHYIDILRRNAAFAIQRASAEETLKQTEAQLQQSQKMDAVGKLAGGIAHEFNNLLTAINGYAHLSMMLPEVTGRLRENLQEVLKAGEHAAVLTRQILAFGRKQMLAPKPIELNTVVDGMQRMLSQIIGENISLVFHPGQGIPLIQADAGQLEQVILNLALNARDAMPTGGHLILSTGYESLVPKESALPPGKYATLTVEDDGIGMNETILAHVFEPFFTTKAIGKGTGLGLSMVDGIIRQSGGYISVESEPGQGTIFRIFMPALGNLTHAAASPREIPVPSATAKAAGTILVVEDEKAVRNLIKEILSSNGYAVLAAGSGKEAVEIAAGHGLDGVDLLLTDVAMPGMNGPELANRLKALRPALKVAYMSGYSESDALKNDTASGIPFIPKPFSPDLLSQRVLEALADSALVDASEPTPG